MPEQPTRTTEIKIDAHLEPTRPDVCTFEVDREVYAEGSAYFTTEEAAKGSPLAEKLFAIGNVRMVRIAKNRIVLAKPDVVDWRVIGKRIADIIREHVQSGGRAVSESFAANRLPDSVALAKLQSLVDERINPALAEHGGHVELVDVKNTDVTIRMGGGCQGCGMARATLRYGIEAAIREHLPFIGNVIDETDHAAGDAPYYQPQQSGPDDS